LLHCQLFVFEVRRSNQLHDRIAEKVWILAVIESETHLIKIGWEMFRTDFMPCSHDALLEQGEGRLDGVRVNVAVRVLARMIDGFMEILLHFIERPRVR
jgi:hypothetical protein